MKPKEAERAQPVPLERSGADRQKLPEGLPVRKRTSADREYIAPIFFWNRSSAGSSYRQ